MGKRIRTTTSHTEQSQGSNVERSPGGQQSNSTAECQRKERRINMFNDEVKPKLELISLFGTPVIKSNIDREFTKKEMECIANIPMNFNEVLRGDISLNRRSQSKDYQLFNTFVEELKDIKTFCEQELKRYLEDIEGVDTDRINLGITASWLNKLKPQDHLTLHNHRNSHLSGVLYIRCLPNDNIQFTNRHLMFNQPLELPKKKKNQFNVEGVTVDIKEGDFIIFPSLLLHQVGVNETENKERISLALDTFPAHLPSLYPPYK